MVAASSQRPSVNRVRARHAKRWRPGYGACPGSMRATISAESRSAVARSPIRNDVQATMEWASTRSYRPSLSSNLILSSAVSRARTQSLTACAQPASASRATLSSSGLSSTLAMAIARFALLSASASSSGVGARAAWIQNGKKASAARNRPIAHGFVEARHPFRLDEVERRPDVPHRFWRGARGHGDVRRLEQPLGGPLADSLRGLAGRLQRRVEDGRLAVVEGQDLGQRVLALTRDLFAPARSLGVQPGALCPRQRAVGHLLD